MVPFASAMQGASRARHEGTYRTLDDSSALTITHDNVVNAYHNHSRVEREHTHERHCDGCTSVPQQLEGEG